MKFDSNAILQKKTVMVSTLFIIKFDCETELELPFCYILRPEYPEVLGDGGIGGDDDDAALVEDDNCEVVVRDDDSIEVTN